MVRIYKYIGIILLAGFSFLYTSYATSLIRKKDPIMMNINSIKDSLMVSKIDPMVINDEYITGLNGCVVDENASYNKMKSSGSFKEELIVMKQDEVKKYDKYIIGGNNKNRNVSIIFLNINKDITNYIQSKKIKINYFLDSNYINNNIISLKNINNKIYSLGRNNNYLSKYIAYDNNMIENNLNNKSNYCLLFNKDDNSLKICNSYKMRTIKGKVYNDNILTYVKENLDNGKIFIFESNDYEDIVISIKYILSKGFNIVYLDDLLEEENSNCM